MWSCCYVINVLRCEMEYRWYDWLDLIQGHVQCRMFKCRSCTCVCLWWLGDHISLHHVMRVRSRGYKSLYEINSPRSCNKRPCAGLCFVGTRYCFCSRDSVPRWTGFCLVVSFSRGTCGQENKFIIVKHYHYNKGWNINIIVKITLLHLWTPVNNES